MSLLKYTSKIDKTGLELIEHGVTSFPVACYHDDLQRRAIDWHWHEELELIIILEGNAIITVDGERCIINKGDGFFINTGVLHGGEIYKSPNCKFNSIVFHPRLIGGSPNSIFWTKYLRPIINNISFKGLFLDSSIQWHKDLLSRIDEAWFICFNKEEGYEFEVRNILSRIFYLMFKHLDCIESNVSAKRLRDSHRMKNMLQYIDEHSSDNITINEIAESISLSVSECLRCFHSTIGTTPKQYVKSFRIKKAAELLRNTDMKIVDIGVVCGFQDMSYFAKTFRNICGCTSSKYRSKN